MHTLPAPARASKSRRIFIALLVMGIAVIVGAVAVVTVLRVRWRQDIERYLAQIRRDGWPANAEELDRWYAGVPAVKNAALIYTQAVAFNAQEEDSGRILGKVLSELPPRTIVLTAELHTNVADLLRDRVEVMRLLRLAAGMRDSRYPVDCKKGYGFPHLAGLRNVGSLLELAVLERCEAGDTAGAVDWVVTSLAAGRSLQREPLALSQLVRMELNRRSCRSLERVVNHLPLSEQQLEFLSSQVVESESTNSLFWGFMGERALLVELLTQAQNNPAKFLDEVEQSQNGDDGPALGQLSAVSGLRWMGYLGYFERDLDFSLAAMETNIQISALQPPRSVETGRRIMEACEQVKIHRALVSAVILSPLWRIPSRDAEDRAMMGTALAALAVERWRRANGNRVPNSLEELVPQYLQAIPEDPFDGRPLRFRKRGSGYAVYSLGPDLRDDGGLEKPLYKEGMSREQMKRYDVTFTQEH